MLGPKCSNGKDMETRIKPKNKKKNRSKVCILRKTSKD